MSTQRTSKKRVVAYQIIDHGIDAIDYFPGCGVALTEFSEVHTGACADFPSAMLDALEQIAISSDFDAVELEQRILSDHSWTEFPASAQVNPECEFTLYYVSIRLR